MKNENVFVLSQYGMYIFADKDVNECWFKLQRIQPQSADWACKYEGYSVDEMTKSQAFDMLVGKVFPVDDIHTKKQ